MIEESNIYVIADVHGDARGLDECMADMFMEGYDPQKDTLVQIGDMIDGLNGSDAKAVVQFFREWQEQYGDKVIILAGNHEHLCIEAIGKSEAQSALRMWWYQGGEYTWLSYREVGERPTWLHGVDDTLSKFQPNPTFLNDIEWFQQLPLYHVQDGIIFVHAGLQPWFPVEAQKKNALLWIREEFYADPFEWEETVVYGHTARQYPLISGKKLGLDTKWHGEGYVAGAKFTNGKLVNLYGGDRRMNYQILKQNTTI